MFDHVDTLSVVRDLDAIRAALGEDELTYCGISYGTLIGQLYVERFPGRVRALALDSNMDHSLGAGAFRPRGPCRPDPSPACPAGDSGPDR
ncbi:alpha/beta fold hydrolase [Microbispora sitophila]|uniref:alpha/beta fold hydrolase n=1 Tax=Microbispora sitophila TaxID=2771537 RepID=UPI003850FE29